jgi:hypothetical protein
MPNITLSIPKDVHETMKKHREIRWSEIARRSVMEEVEKLKVMDKIASKSKLTMKDVEEINEKVKKGLHTKLK